VDRISNSNVVLASENRGAMAGQVHRTTNGDLPNPNWQVEAGINLAPGDQIVAVAMRSRGAQRVAYALSVNGEIFQNQDVGPGRTGAQPWQRVSGRPVVFSAGNGRGLAIDPFDPDLLVIWTANDAAFSRTGGRFWRSITGSGARTLPAGGIVSIVLDYGSPNFYAGLAVGGVWQSHDEGSSWYPLGQDLPNGILSSLKYHDSTLIATIFGRGLWRLSI